ncbi:hypothetical protein T440DRAFT_470910 [Plenodomus tracheiphilus IPT5]|uniref:Uncharacterized protein n=1 Tax=Plenodomus tracheiphilus IPT5 TaxID=1408161 RepID=A0A6A7AZ13_9PLEO|nr:hypothetical protein T440DRAFT_470910 [Plenodomus tracheiphilus IPT5]
MPSIPPLSTTAVPPASSTPRSTARSTTNDPVSPLTRSTTFPHKTSPAVSTQTPLIDTSTPAINDEPVELDGGCAVESASSSNAQGVVEEGQATGTAQRAAMLASRSKDPGVIVDVPREPTAEEVHAARSGEGLVTPGLRQGVFEGS